MTAMLFANNASSRLFAAISAATTSIRVEAGDGAKFPSPTGSDIFTVTVEDRRSSQIEIMNCTGRSGDILTVVRAQEGTAAQAFVVGATVSNRLTAATMTFLANAIDEAPIDGKQYAREDAAWSEIVIPPGDWDSITDKPVTFPPTLPIPSSGVTGLDAAQAAQDTAIGTKLNSSAYTAADVLTKIKTVDGVGSGLDADLLDGQTGSWYQDRANHIGTQAISTVSGLQGALDAKEDKANKGVANGYASLDASAKVPAAQLPSYVDDVVEYANLAAFPATGATGLIYVALDTGKIYRWSGSAYVEISPSPGSTDAVPEGSTNKYYTDERVDDRAAALLQAGTGISWSYNDASGTLTPTVTLAPFTTTNLTEGTNLYYTNARASAAAPVQSVAGRTGAVTLTKTDVGLANVDNTSDLNKPISTATQTVLDLKLNISAYTAADVLAKLITVDGTGSNLDADLLDGQSGAYYLSWANFTGKPSTFPPTLPIAQSDVTNLVSDLALKAPLVSAALTGTPTAPTATAGTSTTQLATTAFVGAAITADITPWSEITGKPSTFPPTLPITQADVTGLVAGQAAQDTAINLRLTDAASDGIIYGRRNGAWVQTTGGATISDTAPASPSIGQLWFESDSGNTFVWYDDSSSQQWVQMNSATAAAGGAAEPGAVQMFARSTPPVGWLKANGAALSRTVYSNLFAAIGTAFGVGDGSTTFNIPDLRGEFIRTWDDSRGVDPGRAFGSAQGANIESHAHTASSPAHTHTGSGTSSGFNTNHQHYNDFGTGYVSADHTHVNNRPVLGADNDRGSTSSSWSIDGSQAANSGGISANHTHAVQGWAGYANVDHSHTYSFTTVGTAASITVNAAGTGTDTRPRNVALLACIRY